MPALPNLSASSPTSFRVIQNAANGHGREGILQLSSSYIKTPQLFPVACLLSGGTARGGGLWKYILQANETHGLLRRKDLPLMTQVLQFLDFPISPATLNIWRNKGLLKRYQEDVHESLNCTGLFLDSGGYKLLWNQSLDLARFGLSVTDGEGPRNIFELQRDLGGDIIATLDYPLPPGLNEAEAKRRMKGSRKNALLAAQMIQESSKTPPFLYVAVHGQDPRSLKRYIQGVFKDFDQYGLLNIPFGLALGSLVPLRTSHNYAAIIDLILAVREAIPEHYRNRIPIHAFGITGNLIPLLTYLGVDTFDSSSYVQKGRGLTYIDPVTYKGHGALEMSGTSCTCRICKDMDWDRLRNTLTTGISRQVDEFGNYKSKYYADICLHNLEMDLQILEATRNSMSEPLEFLMEHSKRFPVLNPSLELLSAKDCALKSRLSRSVHHIKMPMGTKHTKTHEMKLPVVRELSLDLTSKSFDINANGYEPPQAERILLLVPCSGEKPYSTSFSHRFLMGRLVSQFNSQICNIHKVTVSGLYGPVPQEKENQKEVLSYDFRLESQNLEQVRIVADRIAIYVLRHRGHYRAYFAYATSRAYREALELAVKQIDERQQHLPSQERVELTMLPRQPRHRRMSEFFRQTNVDELMLALQHLLDT